MSDCLRNMFVFNDFPYLFSNYDSKFERHTGRGAGILLVPLCSAAVEAFLSSNFVQSLLKILVLICFSFQDGTEPWTLKTFPKIYNSKELVFSFLNNIVTYCWFFFYKNVQNVYDLQTSLWKLVHCCISLQSRMSLGQ